MKKYSNLSMHMSMIFLLLLVSCSRQTEKSIIGLNQPIRHDDFDYSVTDFSVTKKLGDDSTTLTANGNFYLITFRVTNHAKRVDHPWGNRVAYVIDDQGHIYENNMVAQQRLNKKNAFGWQENYVTHFQSEDTTILVFDIPDTVKQPYLMVRGETLMGDFLNGNQFEKTKIKLF